MTEDLIIQKKYLADCENCFGLCCTALPFEQSADFAYTKDGGVPCRNLQADYRCRIHQNLRVSGFKGCTVYECYGAGQQISQVTYQGRSWRDNPAIAEEMFAVFPIMQQLHEMLYYLHEALSLEATQHIHQNLQKAIAETEQLTQQEPNVLVKLDVVSHRGFVNELLLQTSELVRSTVKQNIETTKQIERIRKKGLIGVNLRGANLRGCNLRGMLLIAADLRNADMSVTDLIGADLRDADLSGANLTGSIFLTQAQVDSAKGDSKTQLPLALSVPKHWLK